MKLSAVTVCVHESDSLALHARQSRPVRPLADRDGAGGSRHIRSAASTVSTATSRTSLEPDGIDILDGSNRMRAMAEGTAALGRSGWVALLSSYVLLPRFFRAQLDAMPLESACRYRLRLARLCTNRKCSSSSDPASPGRVRSPAMACSDLADRRVAACARRACRSRRCCSATAPCSGAPASWRASADRIRARDIALRGLLARSTRPRLLVAGYYPGLDAQTWAPLCAQVFLADDFGLNRRWKDALAVNAAAQLLDRWRAERLASIRWSRSTPRAMRSRIAASMPSTSRAKFRPSGWPPACRCGAGR